LAGRLLLIYRSVKVNNADTRRELEARLERAVNAEERVEIFKELQKLAGWRGADTRPAGEEAQQR
jgi:hypothetical protein